MRPVFHCAIYLLRLLYLPNSLVLAHKIRCIDRKTWIGYAWSSGFNFSSITYDSMFKFVENKKLKNVHVFRKSCG